uniref:Immunoglobulin V-set domain-containing protein n=1 Tax=Electrophorus electricus TaxID=8005 RepID=A0AAY5EE41_ELEEL
MFPVAELAMSLQIPCKVQMEEGVQYRKITWYKVITTSNSLIGLVMKDIPKNSTIFYKIANNSYQIGDDFSLLIPQDSTEQVCEIYRCSLWPPVGHRILKSDYRIPQGHILISVPAVFLILLSVFAIALKYKRREKYTKMPVISAYLLPISNL